MAKLAALVGALLVVAGLWSGQRLWCEVAEPDACDAPRARQARQPVRAESARVAMPALAGDASRTSDAAAPVLEQAPWPLVPRDEAELGQLVVWMRSLPHEELTRLANADHGFRESPLVRMLADLSGGWVVPALGGAAVSEAVPLVKACLVAAYATPRRERFSDPRSLQWTEELAAQLSRAEDDPYGVAEDVAFGVYFACRAQGLGYAERMGRLLQESDNPALLGFGYRFLGHEQEGRALLQWAILHHESAVARRGAAEGLVLAAAGAGMPPESAAETFLAALSQERDAATADVLLGGLASSSSDVGREALRTMALDPREPRRAAALAHLADALEPAQARALLEDVLGEPQLDEAVRASACSALARNADPGAADTLIEMARDDELPLEQRVAGMRALEARPLDPRLSAELEELATSANPGELRANALQLLVEGSAGGATVDLRSLAAADPDEAVRSKAVELAAFEPGQDIGGWLVERAYRDPSERVQAAALCALVERSRFVDPGQDVRGMLLEASRASAEPAVRARLQRCLDELGEPDPRRIRIELERQAVLYGSLSEILGGEEGRRAELQSLRLERRASSLRQDAGRP